MAGTKLLVANVSNQSILVLRAGNICCFLLLLAVLPTEARVGRSSVYNPPDGYYAAAEGLVGAGLKSALHNRIKGHRVLSYGSGGTNSTVAALRVLDAMPGNASQVRLLYSGTGRSASNFGGNSGQWNHEHCWPQAYGVSSGPGNSDVHNLRPCDVQANNERGNLYYAEIAGGSTPTFAPLCRETSAAWMPLPEEKGDLARAMLYMAVRYEGGESTPDLELSDSPSASANRFGRLSDLLRWHREDPVNDEERRRNHLVYTDYQFNRNPFVDDPDYAEMVFRGVPVVRVAGVQPVATEGLTAAVVQISRRGPLGGALTVSLTYSGTAGTAAWQSTPATVTIPSGAASSDLVLVPRTQGGTQGVRDFFVTAATNAAYAPVDAGAEVQLYDGVSGFELWAGGEPRTPANVYRYSIGGASAPAATDGLAPVYGVTSSNITITAIVRTNDPGLTVVAQSVADLNSGAWTTNGIARTIPSDQTGATPGTTQRQTFSTPRGADGAKFLRLQTSLADP